MSNSIKIKRGTEAGIPTLESGEPAFTTDNYDLYVGDGITNHKVGGSDYSEIAANTLARHDAVTVTDSSEIDFTLSGQDISAVLKTGSIDETKLDTSVNASLDLADSAMQPSDSEWVEETNTLTKIDNNTFTIDGGDFTATYFEGVPIKADLNTVTFYTHVETSSYDSGTGKTTVNTFNSGLNDGTGLNKIYYSIVNALNSPRVYAGSGIEVIRDSSVGALTIGVSDDSIKEEKLKVNSPTNNYGLIADSGASGGMKWATVIPLGGKTGGGLDVASMGNDVTIKSGYREINGKWYHWDSDLTFTIGPGGSNANSVANPGSADMLYLYIDESALPADPATALTVANFIDLTTEAAWSASKHGFYATNDRLMGTLYHNGTNILVQSKLGNIHSLAFILNEVNTTNLDAVVTFAFVPPAGVATAVVARLQSIHASAASRYHASYPVDTGGTKLSSWNSIFYDTVVLSGVWTQTLTLPFVTMHNKLWITLSGSDTQAKVETAGWIYHPSV